MPYAKSWSNENFEVNFSQKNVLSQGITLTICHSDSIPPNLIYR